MHTAPAARTLPASFDPPASLRRVQGPALIAGVVGLALAGVGFFVDRAHFFQAWLVGWVFWMSVTLGCTGLLMLHHMTHGAWGLMIRRSLEAVSRVLPLMIVLFVPLLFGLHDLYHWTHGAVVAADRFLSAKAAYLNVPFWIGRNVFYFAVWLYFMWALNRLSRRQDETGDAKTYGQLQAHGAAGFLTLALTGTFAAIDWLMSLDPHWFSSLYGLWFFAGMGLSGLTFVIVVAYWLAGREPMASVMTARHFHDYGKLFFAFVMLWAYLSFSQFLLIWAGNLPEEIPFYLRRMGATQWSIVSAILLVGHFVLPFLILLSADVKQRSRTLVKVAVWVLVMRWVDFFWNVAPTLQAQHAAEGAHGWSWSGVWIDVAAAVGIGGLFVWYFGRQLVQRPLLPKNDPFLAEALAHE
jgi:hypothetical protein